MDLLELEQVYSILFYLYLGLKLLQSKINKLVIDITVIINYGEENQNVSLQQ